MDVHGGSAWGKEGWGERLFPGEQGWSCAGGAAKVDGATLGGAPGAPISLVTAPDLPCDSSLRLRMWAPSILPGFWVPGSSTAGWEELYF